MVSWLLNKKNCVVPNCRITVKDPVATFKFPTDERIGRKWIEALKSEELSSIPYDQVSNVYRVCAYHFLPDTVQTVGSNVRTRSKLSYGSVPCLNLPNRIIPWNRPTAEMIVDAHQLNRQQQIGNESFAGNELIKENVNHNGMQAANNYSNNYHPVGNNATGPLKDNRPFKKRVKFYDPPATSIESCNVNGPWRMIIDEHDKSSNVDPKDTQVQNNCGYSDVQTTNATIEDQANSNKRKMKTAIKLYKISHKKARMETDEVSSTVQWQIVDNHYYTPLKLQLNHVVATLRKDTPELQSYDRQIEQITLARANKAMTEASSNNEESANK